MHRQCIYMVLTLLNNRAFPGNSERCSVYLNTPTKYRSEPI